MVPVATWPSDTNMDPGDGPESTDPNSDPGCGRATDADMALDRSPDLGNTAVPGDSAGLSDQHHLFSYTAGFLIFPRDCTAHSRLLSHASVSNRDMPTGQPGLSKSRVGVFLPHNCRLCQADN